MSYFFAAAGPRSPAAMLTTWYGRPRPPMICSSIARMRSSSSHDSSGAHEREHLDLVELVDAEDAARVLAVGAGLAPEARRVARVARRQRVGRERVAAVQRGERHLARADEEQLAVVDVVDLGAVGREEARPLPSCARARASGVTTGVNPCGDDRRHRVVDERELEQRGFAHDVGEARAARFGRTRGVDEADAPLRTRRGRAAAPAFCSPTRLISSPSSSPPSGTDASAEFGTCSASSRNCASASCSACSSAASSSFSVAGGFDLRLRARRARPCRSPSTPRSGAPAAPRPRSPARGAPRRPRARRRSARRAPACVRCPRRYSGFVAQPFEIDHVPARSVGRIWARNPLDPRGRVLLTPCRPPAAARRPPRRDRRPDTNRGTSPRRAWRRRCAARRRPARRRRDLRSR